MTITFPLTDLQEVSVKKYLSRYITIQEIHDVTGDNVISIDVTDAVFSTVTNIDATCKYYLIPVHNRDNVEKLYYHTGLKKLTDDKEKKILADAFYDIIEKYYFNKYAFEYFKIVAIKNAAINTTYTNGSTLVSGVINNLLESGISTASSTSISNEPAIYNCRLSSISVMQYKGYNNNEITQWLSSVTSVIVDPFVRNDIGIKQMSLNKNNKVYHINMNDYVVKPSNTSCIIVSDKVFESLYIKLSNTLVEFYYGSDTTTTVPTTSSDVTDGISNKETVTITTNTSFDIEVDAGDKRVIFAYPASFPSVKHIIRFDYQGDNDYIGIFNKTIVPVIPNATTGTVVNYNVYTWIVNEAFTANTKFKVIF